MLVSELDWVMTCRDGGEQAVQARCSPVQSAPDGHACISVCARAQPLSGAELHHCLPLIFYAQWASSRPRHLSTHTCTRPWRASPCPMHSPRSWCSGLCSSLLPDHRCSMTNHRSRKKCRDRPPSRTRPLARCHSPAHSGAEMHTSERHCEGT